MSLRLWLRASYGHQGHQKTQQSWKAATSIFLRTCSNTMMWFDQRKVVYAQRDSLLATNDASETIADFLAEVVNTNY